MKKISLEVSNNKKIRKLPDKKNLPELIKSPCVLVLCNIRGAIHVVYEYDVGIPSVSGSDRV